MGCERHGQPAARVENFRGATDPDSSRPLQRLVVTVFPNGVVPATWFPEGGEEEFSTGPSMAPMPQFGLPGLGDFADELLFFRGLDNVAAASGPEGSHNEGVATMLTGRYVEGEPGSTWHSWQLFGPSLDRYVAARLEEAAGAPFPRKTLPIAQSTAINRTVSYEADGTPVPGHNDVAELFDDLFGLATLSAAEREALRLERHSVLDGVLDNYARLQKQVGAADRARLVPEGAGTLWDSVVLMQGSDVATGSHNHNNMPFVLAGSAAGALKTGRFWTCDPPRPHQALLLTLLHAFGIPDDTFGEPSLDTGVLSGVLA
jgi:hypothetical protein